MALGTVTVRSTGQATSGSTITSSSFTPTANSLLLAFCGYMCAGNVSSITVGTASGGSLTWNKEIENGGEGQNTFAHSCSIHWAYVGSSPGSMTISVTGNEDTMYRSQLVIIEVASGFHATDPIGLTGSNQNLASSGGPATRLASLGGTTASDSRIFVLGSAEGTAANMTGGDAWTQHYQSATSDGIDSVVLSESAAITDGEARLGSSFFWGLVAVEVIVAAASTGSLLFNNPARLPHLIGR